MTTQQLKQFRRAIWLGGLLMVALYLLAVAGLGASDYDQAVADHEWTCQMIREGVYPPELATNCPEPVETLASK